MFERKVLQDLKSNKNIAKIYNCIKHCEKIRFQGSSKWAKHFQVQDIGNRAFQNTLVLALLHPNEEKDGIYLM